VTPNRNRAQFDKYRSWQWIKHLALADYLVPWASKVGSTADVIYVVDLFAGAGTYTDAVTGEVTEGSPVIFARQALRYAERRPGKYLKVICCERDAENYRQLRDRVAGFGSLVTTLRGSFSRHAEDILSITGTAPALILFDPIGLKAISAEQIRPILARRGKTDVFMTLHFKVVHRTAGMLVETGHADPDIPGARRAAMLLDVVFGTQRWRQIAKNPRLDTAARERAYADLYLENILGDLFKWSCAYPVRSKYLSPTQYWLAHASDHLDAHLLMNDEIVKVETELFTRTYGDGAFPEMISMENEARVEAAESRLRASVLEAVEASPDGAVTISDLRAALLPDFFGQVKQGAYKRIPKSLAKEGLLSREKRLGAAVDDHEWFSLPTVPERRVGAA
jgi:three-Cys-motif partner protein